MNMRVAGFTLVELMAAILIAAILITLAVPNFSSTVKANRVQSQLSDFQSDLAYARSEAVSRSKYVTVCPTSDNGGSCSGNWGDGWFIFVEDSKLNNVGSFEGSDRPLRKHSGLSGNTLRVVDNSVPGVAQGHITFFNSGDVAETKQMTLWICDSGNDVKYARALLKIGGGQFLYSTANVGGVYKNVSGGALTCP